MLNKMSKVVCKSFWCRCFSVNHSLSTICGISLVLMCSILPITGTAADKGEIIFKSKIQRPDCTVKAPASIVLDDITVGHDNNDGRMSTLYPDNEAFDITIDCSNPINVTSYITVGTKAGIWSDGYGAYMQGSSGDNNKIIFSLEYLEDDKFTYGLPLANHLDGTPIVVAALGNDGTMQGSRRYCTGDTDRTCSFRPIISVTVPQLWPSGKPEASDFGDFSLSVTFYLNYL